MQVDEVPMHTLARALIAAAILGPWALPARAEDPPPPPPPPPPAPPSGERVTMPAQRGLVRALLEINLSAEAALDPLSIAPDLWYGVSDRLTVGLVHSRAGTTGLMGGVGSSLCLAGDGCGDAYRNVAVDARYTLKPGPTVVAGTAGLVLRGLDPFQLALKLGAVGRYRPAPGSKLAIDFAPSVLFGITERAGAVPVGMAPGGPPNKEVLVAPITALYALRPKLSLAAQVGVFLPIEDAADLYTLSLALGATYLISPQITAEAALGLPALGGGEQVGATGFDARTLTLGGSYAF
jgi:hypothetical protein